MLYWFVDESNPAFLEDGILMLFGLFDGFIFFLGGVFLRGNMLSGFCCCDWLFLLRSDWFFLFFDLGLSKCVLHVVEVDIIVFVFHGSVNSIQVDIISQSLGIIAPLQ